MSWCASPASVAICSPRAAAEPAGMVTEVSQCRIAATSSSAAMRAKRVRSAS
jgi:hypothetical protein